jgi:hypothetical protein
MISVDQNIATPEPDDRKSSEERKLALPERTRTQSPPINSSAIANNRTTAINPASPAHDLRGQAVGERSQIIQGKSGATFVLGSSNIEPLQRVYVLLKRGYLLQKRFAQAVAPKFHSNPLHN